MKESGTKTKCTEEEHLLGEMEKDTKDSSSMIKERATVLLNGRMDVSMKVNGKMGSSMESEYSLQKTTRSKKENGKMERK